MAQTAPDDGYPCNMRGACQTKAAAFHGDGGSRERSSEAPFGAGTSGGHRVHCPRRGGPTWRTRGGTRGSLHAVLGYPGRHPTRGGRSRGSGYPPWGCDFSRSHRRTSRDRKGPPKACSHMGERCHSPVWTPHDATSTIDWYSGSVGAPQPAPNSRQCQRQKQCQVGSIPLHCGRI